MVVIGLGGYFLVYRPFHQWQLDQGRQELAEAMPAQMDALYQAIFEVTKIQQASNDAADIRDRGKAAAKAGDRPAAERHGDADRHAHGRSLGSDRDIACRSVATHRAAGLRAIAPRGSAGDRGTNQA